MIVEEFDERASRCRRLIATVQCEENPPVFLNRDLRPVAFQVKGSNVDLSSGLTTKRQLDPTIRSQVHRGLSSVGAI